MRRERKGTAARAGFTAMTARNVRAMRNKPAARRRKKIEPPLAEEEFPSTCPPIPEHSQEKR
jgi:hypothetical protein